MVRAIAFILLFLSNPVIGVCVASEQALPESELLRLEEKSGQPFCTRGCFEDEVSAHRAAGEWLLQAALEARREASWRLYRLADSTFTFSYPEIGEREATQSRMPPLAADLEYVSAGHIHWDDVHQFSAQDWNWVTGNRKTLYLVTRERILWRASPQHARGRGRSGGISTRSAIAFDGQRVARLEIPSGSSSILAADLETMVRP